MGDGCSNAPDDVRFVFFFLGGVERVVVVNRLLVIFMAMS